MEDFIITPSSSREREDCETSGSWEGERILASRSGVDFQSFIRLSVGARTRAPFFGVCILGQTVIVEVPNFEAGRSSGISVASSSSRREYCCFWREYFEQIFSKMSRCGMTRVLITEGWRGMNGEEEKFSNLYRSPTRGRQWWRHAHSCHHSWWFWRETRSSRWPQLKMLQEDERKVSSENPVQNSFSTNRKKRRKKTKKKVMTLTN